jgi:hypothetical protein
MILFTSVKARRRFNAGGAIRTVRRFHAHQNGFANFLLFFIQVPNGRSILALGLVHGRMHARPLDHQVFVGNTTRIKLHQQSFRMILNVPIGRIGLFPTRISHETPGHAREAQEARLRPPKSATGTKEQIVPRTLGKQRQFGAGFVVDAIHFYQIQAFLQIRVNANCILIYMLRCSRGSLVHSEGEATSDVRTSARAILEMTSLANNLVKNPNRCLSSLATRSCCLEEKYRRSLWMRPSRITQPLVLVVVCDFKVTARSRCMSGCRISRGTRQWSCGHVFTF